MNLRKPKFPPFSKETEAIKAIIQEGAISIGITNTITVLSGICSCFPKAEVVEMLEDWKKPCGIEGCRCHEATAIMADAFLKFTEKNFEITNQTWE